MLPALKSVGSTYRSPWYIIDSTSTGWTSEKNPCRLALSDIT